MKWLSQFKTKILYILGAAVLAVGFPYFFSHWTGFRSLYIREAYPGLSHLLRLLTGWCPFSLGDLLYVAAGAWLLIGGFSFVRQLIWIRRHPFGVWTRILRFVLLLFVIYDIFLLLWGLNYRYNRLYAAFGISQAPYSVAELGRLCDTLVDRVNRQHMLLAGNDTAAVAQSPAYGTIKKQAIADYKRMAQSNAHFRYAPASVKPSMFGYLMNYAGVTGYYNPFTGEAQINTTPPAVALPFTTCHEMAHQLGYAAEDDANFISYMVTASSDDLYFRYSANFSLLLYALNQLSFKQPRQADSLWNKQLSVGVRQDYTAYFAFYEKFRTRFKPLLDQAYDQYLKANEQAEGIRSYRGVVALLLSYIRRYGHLP